MDVKQFFHYIDNFTCGKINLPTLFDGRFNSHYNVVDLEVLGKSIRAYIQDTDDIEAIIIFGSAISNPTYIFEKYYKKKYWLFGKRIELQRKKYIKCNDVDFLIITNKKYFEGEFINPNIEEYRDGSCGMTSELYSSGIDLMNRDVSQIKKGIENNDTISISALETGCILADNGILKTFGIKNKCSYDLKFNKSNRFFEICLENENCIW